MPTPQYEPTVPMPETTKKAGKRRKHTFTTYGGKPISMRQPNEIGLIYRKGTDCLIADDNLEKRLSTYGPPVTPRSKDNSYLW